MIFCISVMVGAIFIVLMVIIRIYQESKELFKKIEEWINMDLSIVGIGIMIACAIAILYMSIKSYINDYRREK